VDLQRGLVACYAFSGNANDGTGHNHHGTVMGAALTADRFGVASSAYQFDGVSDYISIPAAPFVNSNYSYSLWARAASLPGIGNSAIMFSIGDATSRHQTVNIANVYSTEGFVGITGGGYNNTTPPTTTSVQSGILPATDTWYHIVSVRVNAEMRLYINGVLIATTSTNLTEPYYGTDPNAILGARCNLTQPFNGVIDDVVIYNRALNLTEIEELYQHGIPCTTPTPDVDLQRGLVACYAFSGNAEDGSGHAYHGTLVGPVPTSDRFGRIDAAYQFDGIGDYISLPAEPLKANKDYSFSMWVKVITNPSNGGSATLISIGKSSGTHVGVTLTNHYSSADFLGWTSGGSNEAGSNPSINSAESRSLPNPNQWYHVVTTRDKDFLTLYVNGVYVAAQVTNGTRPLYFDPGTYTATLGIRAGFFQALNAVLDDVVIYDRAIHPAEVYELYTVGLPCSAPPPTPIVVNVTDQTQCGDGYFTLTASGNAQYKWYDAETGGNLLQDGDTYTTSWLTKTTSYYVTGTLDGVTSDPKKVTATVLPQPNLACLFFDSALVGVNTVYAVTVGSGLPPFLYTFDFGDGTIVQTPKSSANYIYTDVGNHRVKVFVEDANHCTAFCEASVEVVEEVIFIPNVITPDNDDHLNDVFTLYIITNDTYNHYTGIKTFSMTIKNRWGREVFSTTDANAGWRGQNVASGTYYYLIKFGDKQYKGWVHVVK
jgi:hypothetical protein